MRRQAKGTDRFEIHSNGEISAWGTREEAWTRVKRICAWLVETEHTCGWVRVIKNGTDVFYAQYGSPTWVKHFGGPRL